MVAATTSADVRPLACIVASHLPSPAHGERQRRWSRLLRVRTCIGCPRSMDELGCGSKSILDGAANIGQSARASCRRCPTRTDPIKPCQRSRHVPPPSANCSPTNIDLCAGDPTAPPEEPAAPVVVTLRDIASFRPAAPDNGMEPGGWAIEGLPANFVAGASVQVVSGTLLGQPADVRFTPVGYRWTHSDGAVVEADGPGATWAALGQREFTATATSHVYAIRRRVHGRPVGGRARRVPIRRVAVAVRSPARSASRERRSACSSASSTRCSRRATASRTRPVPAADATAGSVETSAPPTPSDPVRCDRLGRYPVVVIGSPLRP